MEEGEVIPAGTPITSVIGLDRLKIKISLNERDLHILQNRKVFDFTVDAIPGEIYSSRAFFLSPTAESNSRFFPLELMVEKPDPRMADGMTARIKFPHCGREKIGQNPRKLAGRRKRAGGSFC